MATTTIGELTAATTPLTGTEMVELEITGPAPRRTTTQDIADRAPTLLPIIDDATATCTLALSDHNRKRRFTGSATVTVTVPDNASVAFPIGSVCPFRQVGTGLVSVVAAGGVTLNIPNGLVASAARQGSELAVHKVATNTWDLTGDLEAL